jgi:hypothetical protein
VTMVVMKLAAALETRTIGVGLGCHGGVTGKLDSISMGDVMLAAAGRRDVLLPTDFVVSQRRYRSARVGHCCWRGGRTIRSCRSGGNGRIGVRSARG